MAEESSCSRILFSECSQRPSVNSRPLDHASIPESNDPRISIAPGVQKGKLWLSCGSPEGGDFPRKDVLEAIKRNCLYDYYVENF